MRGGRGLGGGGAGGGGGGELVRNLYECVCVCVPNHVAHLFKFRLLVGTPVLFETTCKKC